jgi:hypothetical protein
MDTLKTQVMGAVYKKDIEKYPFWPQKFEFLRKI